ncbi:MAG: hypothetical protein ACRCVJ_18655 [Clostridium sp.]|uniref:hypothetical protein n=1 Tax=Clostridium sp. TaxID=1506 RepID=UPI003F32BE20
MSCKYCNAMKNGKTIKVNQRSTYADDNMCENICNDNCSNKSCKQDFLIKGYECNNEVRVSLEWNCEIKGCNKEINIQPFSESIKIKYCPFCGEQISFSKDEKYTNSNIEICEEGI